MRKVIIMTMMVVIGFCMLCVPTHASEYQPTFGDVKTTEYVFNDIENITISNDTLEMEKRGYICVSADVVSTDSNIIQSEKINLNSGVCVYGDTTVFNEETQMYESEEIKSEPYKELYLAIGTPKEDYDSVADYDNGHAMYLSYCEQIKNLNKTVEKKVIKTKKKTVKKVKKSKALTKKQAKKIIKKSHKRWSIDKIKLVDKYVKGKWYCYYVYANSDCYVITIKNKKIDCCYQLN